MKTNAEKKAESFIRELVLYPMAIFYFPLATIRIVIWTWHRWIENNNNAIRQYKELLEIKQQLKKH